MAQVKLGFRQMTVPEKIQVSKSVITLMTGNLSYPTPNPTLAAVTTAITNLEKAYEAAHDGGKSKTAFMRTQEKALIGLIVQLTAYIQVASGGDSNIILSSGMQVRSTATPPQPLPQPEAVKVMTSSNEGEVNLKWQPIYTAVAYVIQQSLDGNTNWTESGNSTKSNIAIGGLVSGSRAFFRVAAIGPKGQSPWSSPARGMAG
jgi:hypothetical protein